MNIDELRQWIGREETLDDVATRAPLRGLAATLDRDASFDQGADVPPLWHWMYFLPSAPTAELGVDGHPSKGGFLPPIPLPRRMWAGSRTVFNHPLRVGQAICRRSTVTDITLKDGRTGPLVFVKVRHELSAERRVAICEEQDIVYRNPPSPSERAVVPQSAAAGAVWRRRIEPSPVLLFRYSALTFNGHRIHYDRPYAMQEEGYAGLVVHGPLTATLMLELLHQQRPGATVREFSFRAVQPLLDISPFHVCGAPQDDGTVRLWAENGEGAVATQATARLA